MDNMRWLLVDVNSETDEHPLKADLEFLNVTRSPAGGDHKVRGLTIVGPHPPPHGVVGLPLLRLQVDAESVALTRRNLVQALRAAEERQQVPPGMPVHRRRGLFHVPAAPGPQPFGQRGGFWAGLRANQPQALQAAADLRGQGSKSLGRRPLDRPACSLGRQ